MLLLVRMFRRAEADKRAPTVDALRRQLRSADRDTRLLALVRMRHQIARGRLRKAFREMAAGLVEDRNTFCRWQATIIVGEFIHSSPQRVWAVARRLAYSPNADIRMAATTVLLEHLLEYQSQLMIPVFMAELDHGHRRFADAVGGCANFAESPHKRQAQVVINRARGLTSA